MQALFRPALVDARQDVLLIKKADRDVHVDGHNAAYYVAGNIRPAVVI